MKKLMMAVMIAGMAAGALADVSFSYSGQLRTETGGKVTAKNPKITFSLYNVATGGAALWSRMIPVLLDANGYFAVELSNANGSAVGTETKLETVIANNATLYVGLNVENSSGEISPRQKLLSTPRAAFAEDVQTAKQGFSVSGGAATFSDGIQVKNGATTTIELKKDGEITAKKLTVATINNDTSVGGTLSAATLDATTVKQGGNTLIPSGIVVMWSGAVNKIPAGWALCDGNNGTPNLKGRFIVGYDPNDGDYNAKGNTGGAKNVTLTTGQMPKHQHGYLLPARDQLLYGADDAYHPQYMSMGGQKSYNLKDIFPELEGVCGVAWRSKYAIYVNYTSISPYFAPDQGGYIYISNTTSTGDGSSHENRPPYYALAYIMKL